MCSLHIAFKLCFLERSLASFLVYYTCANQYNEFISRIIFNNSNTFPGDCYSNKNTVNENKQTIIFNSALASPASLTPSPLARKDKRKLKILYIRSTARENARPSLSRYQKTPMVKHGNCTTDFPLHVAGYLSGL